MNCRHCDKPLEHDFLDLGFAPPSNAYLSERDLHRPETHFPLKLGVCTECWLVQTEDYASAKKLFSDDYAYFSSTSSSWLKHAERYSKRMIEVLQLNEHSSVIEIACNDGYLLKNFVAAGIPCLGIEPTDSTAAAAEALNIPVMREFFGAEMARRLAVQGRQADLIAGNNVYAHVPDINDFTRGLQLALKTGGTITLEFPHLMKLIEFCQFDTVYHEHFSYLSLHVVARILAQHDLRVFDVEQLPTHGGSLRVYGCHADDLRATSSSVKDLMDSETGFGLTRLESYLGFQERADKAKNGLLEFLLQQKRDGKLVAAYGAAAKGNTLLNYAGVKPDLLPFVCDAASSKQNKFLPGSHIPILHPDKIGQAKPDVLLVLPWNIVSEIKNGHGYIGDWGGRFAIAIPELAILEP